ncbi:unnamed protein product [Macrosiphum euphorbiae]|nr:unnamed protein product [Macrosiphum euphorbiae]
MDFNSHNSVRENYQSGENGELLHEWFTLINLELIYNAKDKGAFRSRKGEKTTHLINSRTSLDGSNIVTRYRQRDFLHGQHRPVIFRIWSKSSTNTFNTKSTVELTKGKMEQIWYNELYVYTTSFNAYR